MIKYSFPEYRQCYSYDCGANIMESVLAYYGFDVSESEVMKLAKTNCKSGTSITGLKKVARMFGLKCKEGKLNITFLKKCIKDGKPVVIALQAWRKKVKNWKNEWSAGHYVVPIGYDNKRIYFDDPASIFRTFLTFDELKERWHDQYYINGKSKRLVNWGLIVYGKKPVFKADEAVHMDYDSFNEKKSVYKKYRRMR